MKHVSNDKKLERERMRRKVWRFIFVILVLGFVFVAAISTQVIVWDGFTFRKNFYSYMYAFGTIGLVAGGCFCTGGLLGFLFGLPRLIKNTTDNEIEETTKRSISQNDNLVQISDWVTKIIVGVGLTQLYRIPGYLLKIGKQLAPSFALPINEAAGQNAAIATILYFIVTGFICVYIWTRLDFTEMLEDSERGLNNLEENVESVKRMTNSIQETLVDIGRGSIMDFTTFTREREAANAVIDYNEDPQKGKWGGKPEQNGRKLSAVVETTFIPNLYKVTLTVESTVSTKPLTGTVVFHLHNTFRNTSPSIAVENGKAVLNLNMVYGAFTVGAVADNGETTLELDLAELPNAPEKFKER